VSIITGIWSILHSFEDLRIKYPQFIYHGYRFDVSHEALDVSFRFEIPGLSIFEPTWSFPFYADDPRLDDPVLQRLVFSLGMTELISYWKLTCSPTVVLCTDLGEDQIEWWKKLYWGGLGEFFHVNGIRTDLDSFMVIEPDTSSQEKSTLHSHTGMLHAHPSANANIMPLTALRHLTEMPHTQTAAYMSVPPESPRKSPSDKPCLVPVGGGKDSVVTLNALRNSGRFRLYAYMINPVADGSSVASARLAGIPSEHMLTARRSLDRRLIDYNRQGFLNGHTPFSAIVAFSSSITAYINKITYIALSNESSANEPTVAGGANHQYSKSFEFENDFHAYERNFIGSRTYYFSLLRPLSELQIAAYFSGLPDFLSVFRSCNVGSKQDRWCGKCAKCLFVALILSPFLEPARLAGIFGVDILDDGSLEGIFYQLIGLAPEKPFECVGSRNEVNCAINLGIAKYLRNGWVLPKLFMLYAESPFYNIVPDAQEYITYFDTHHIIPKAFNEILDAVREAAAERIKSCMI
jgi:hypothetical protein